MTTIPTTIPYEDDLYKWNYDDHGILCRYSKEEESWEVMEPQCVDCGHRPDDCACPPPPKKKTPCPHCAKEFVRVKAHITKSGCGKPKPVTTPEPIKVPEPEPEPEEDEEEGVKETCPHCGDEEVLTDRSFNPVWTERFPARVCWGCYSGEKDRECEDCGDTFTPCVDDTYVVCGDCYERQQGGKGLPLRDRIWSWLLSHADEYNGKTAREIAKALGEEKHAVNQALYADPSPFLNFAMAGQKAPVWRVRM
jgi:hypothetical protein